MMQTRTIVSIHFVLEYHEFLSCPSVEVCWCFCVAVHDSVVGARFTLILWLMVSALFVSQFVRVLCIRPCCY